MTDEWFCEIAGREIGPLSAQQLRAMAVKGQVVPGDRVRQGQSPWVAAEQVRGLFPPPSQPPAATVPKQNHLPTAQPAPRPPAAPNPNPNPTPKTSSPPALPRAEAWEPEPEADAPNSINIVTDSPTSGAVRVGTRIILPHAKRQLQQQKMMVILLLVAIVGLAVAALILVVSGGPGKIESSGGGLTKLAKNIAEKAKESETTVENPKDAETPEELDSSDMPRKRPKITADLFAEPGEKTDKTAVAPSETKEPEWVDASAGPARVEDVAIKIAEVVNTAPNADSPAEGRLLITVEVKNLSESRKLEFSGWIRGGIARGIRLTDNFNNVYRAQPVGRASTSGGPVSIYPSRSRRETLAFEPPIDKAEFLRIELPASALGQSGAVRLKIPAAMIVQRAEESAARDAPPEEEPPEGRPGTPLGDFGIPNE